MNFGSAGKGFFSVLAQRMATALFFCVMFLLFVVTCHPLSNDARFELAGTADDCCTEHVTEARDAHTSPLADIVLPNGTDFIATLAVFVAAVFFVWLVVVPIAESTVQLRDRLLRWLWARPWPFAWNGGYLPYFSPMRDA